ncbi:alpha/beta hydrolases superfamily protein [Tanacetum coccineum]
MIKTSVHFSDLGDLMMELVDTYKIRLPKFTFKFAIQYMKRAILKKAKFDILDLSTIKSAKSSFVPVLFCHAVDDDFIHPHHSDRIYEAYMYILTGRQEYHQIPG